MNVFYTNSNPIICAHDHCTVHNRKMIIEYAQILSAAHHVLDEDKVISGVYKLTHKNHPSAIWIRESSDHYNYVLNVALELCSIYQQAAGKTHKTYYTLLELKQLPLNIANNGFKCPPVAAPDKYKMLVVLGKSTEHAYQEYLKSKFEEWQQRDNPIKVQWYSGQPHWISN